MFNGNCGKCAVSGKGIQRVPQILYFNESLARKGKKWVTEMNNGWKNGSGWVDEFKADLRDRVREETRRI